MINGLSHYQAVMLSNGNVQVCLPSGTYKVDGVEVKISSYKEDSIVVSQDAVLQKVKHLGTQLVGYEHPEEGAITIEKWLEIEQGLYGVWDDDVQEYVYTSLEHEFKCRKQQEYWSSKKPVYKDLGVELEPVEYTIIGSFEDTGSPYIQTPIRVGSVKWKGIGSSGIYKCDLTKAAYDRYKEYEVNYGSNFKFNNDLNREYLRFAKINGDYIFGDCSPFTEKCFAYCGTLEEAKEKIQDAIKAVDAKVLPILAPKNFDTKYVSSICKSIEIYTSQVQKLPVNKKADSDHRAIVNNLKKLTNDISTRLMATICDGD